MKNYIEAGNTLDWTNGTGKEVVSGGIVVVGDLVAIAAGNIAADQDGVLYTSGVFELPKDTAAISLGKKVYSAGGKITSTAGSGNPVAGVAWADAAAADTACLVRLGS